MKIFPLLILSAFTASCATMSKEECKVANWKDIGFSDAARGKPMSLADHADACASTGIAPDRNQYMLGYNEGEKSYCTYENGLKAGESNKYVGDLCKKADLTVAFYDGYQLGKQRYTKKMEMQQKQDQRIAQQKRDQFMKPLSPTPPVAGGYSRVDPDSQDVFEINKFLEQELYARDGREIWTKTILKAEKQVVAGTNYRLTVLMSDGKTYEAVIYQDLQGAVELTSYQRI